MPTPLDPAAVADLLGGKAAPPVAPVIPPVVVAPRTDPPPVITKPAAAPAAAPDFAAQLAAATAKIAELTAQVASGNGDASAIADLSTRLDDQSASFVKADLSRLEASRTEAFDRLGVAPEYRDVIPSTFDPRTVDGRKQMEEWISKRPALAASRAPKPPVVNADGFGSRVQEILSGKRKSTLVSTDSISRMLRDRVG